MTAQNNRSLPWRSWTFGPKLRWVSAAAGIAIFVLLAVNITSLARHAYLQMRQLNTANTDNLQWTLSQTEVEFLQLNYALVTVQTNPNADLDALRRWFDIFYSRINIIRNGPNYAALSFDVAMRIEFDRIDTFIARTLPLIDSPDAVLRANVPYIAANAANLRSAVRNISLEGIRIFSKVSDTRRQSISDTIEQIALLTLGLIVLLLAAVLMLNRMYHLSRLQAQENQATRDRLQAMLNTSLDAVLVVNNEGRFIEFNGAASEIFGYSQAEAIGQDMTKLIFADHMIQAHLDGMQNSRSDGAKHIISAGRVQMVAKRKSGEQFPVELSVAKTHSPEGQIFVSYLRDISERVQAERRLTKARDDALAGERAKARFMAVMSHEMRTPLNGLLGSLELLKTTKLSPKQGEFAEVMQKSGELLLHHVNDVLDIARLENGRMIGENAPLDLDQLVQEVLESQSALARAKGLDLRYRPEAGPIGQIIGSAIGLRQVLLNLVNNAIKFTAQGLVEVQASIIDMGAGEGSDKRLSLRVRDTGIGISLADQARVFDDFVTLDSSFGRRADGTGLGLGIAQRIVHAMGGEIGVVSQPKLGATFWLDLPYSPAANVPNEAQPIGKVAGKLKPRRSKSGAMDPPPAPSGLNILIVEDNQINRFILREMLVSDGHRVTEAADGLKGVTLAQEQRFDLIFMDISMPALDGIAATVRLRAGTGPCANAPIVALTAHALPDDQALFLASGMDAVLNKPLDRKRMTQVMQNLVPHASAAPAPMKPIPKRANPRRPRAASLRSEDGSALLRIKTLDELTATLGPKRFGDLMLRFHSEGAAMIDESLAYLAAGDGAKAQGVLHMLAGASATFGARALQNHLGKMEADLKAEDLQAAGQKQSALVALWEASKTELAAYMQAAAAAPKE
jgi:PAS domain S-box-containing protein